MAKIKIIKNKIVQTESPFKLIGFSVQSDDGDIQIYHEVILDLASIEGKTDEECVDIAYSNISSSISSSISKIDSQSDSIIGKYYVP
jgi:hypothetical protein